ncbi:MAG: Uma2 family endonuclease [Planctomycetota bacterium]
MVVQKPLRYASNALVCSRTAFELQTAVRSKKFGVVVGPGCGFVVARNPDSVLAPAAAFVSAARLSRQALGSFFFPCAPTLAVEVVSPNESADEVHAKAQMWIESGSEVVWLVWPGDRTVSVYRSPDNVRVLTTGQTLEGDDVLPGFAVPVADLFAGLK